MLPSSIIFSEHPEKDLQKFIGKHHYSNVAVLVDTNTEKNCYPKINLSLPPHIIIRINPGEEHKTIESCTHVWSELTRHSFDRNALVIALGGGVLGDLGGFCAATFKRGIDFVLIPTTLLALADASIGGKLGIDFQHFKNHIGLFKQPVHTILSTQFLNTLPAEEMRSGFAEVIKHALLSDKPLFDLIKTKSIPDLNFKDLIEHSVQFKYSIIKKDPEEKGIRKILNFGHTIGHAIETGSMISGSRILHGEAIAAGMIAECHISQQKGLISDHVTDEITKCLVKYFGKIAISQDATLTLIGQDKKNKSGKILMSLLKGIGKPVWDIEVTKDEIRNSLSFYESLQM